MSVSATTDLLIGQWRNSDRLRGAVQIFLDLVEEELESALDALARMRSLDTAEGYWLDAIGARLGIRRPLLTSREVPDIGDRWGYDSIGEPYGHAPFKGSEEHATTAPAGDDIYRRLIRARAITITGSPTIGTLRAALRELDSGATAEDRTDMTVDVRSDPAWPVRVAYRMGALPIPAGVRMRLGSGRNWGFDEAGDPFDRAGFEEF